MDLQEQNFKAELAEKILKEYNFNGHRISKEKIIDITNRVVELIEISEIRKNKIDEFFHELKLGGFGLLASNPLDFVIKFRNFSFKNGRNKILSI